MTSALQKTFMALSAVCVAALQVAVWLFLECLPILLLVASVVAGLYLYDWLIR